MIAAFFIFCLIGLVVTCMTGPKKDMVHAARAKPVPGVRRTRWPLWSSTLLFAKDGSRFKRKGVYFAEAFGSSMLDVDIEDGDLIAGQYIGGLSDDEKSERINTGSVVVVNAPAAGSPCKKRLRLVREISGGSVSFYEDRNGDDHSVRPLSQIEAVIERKFI